MHLLQGFGIGFQMGQWFQSARIFIGSWLFSLAKAILSLPNFMSASSFLRQNINCRLAIPMQNLGFLLPKGHRASLPMSNTETGTLYELQVREQIQMLGVLSQFWQLTGYSFILRILVLEAVRKLWIFCRHVVSKKIG